MYIIILSIYLSIYLYIYRFSVRRRTNPHVEVTHTGRSYTSTSGDAGRMLAQALHTGQIRTCPPRVEHDMKSVPWKVENRPLEGPKSAPGGLRRALGRPGGPHLAAKAARKPNLGGSWGAPGALLAALGVVLGRLGRSWGLLGRPGLLLGASWGSFWHLPGADLGVLAGFCSAT